jgi:rRNA maturation RNase YbeY
MGVTYFTEDVSFPPMKRRKIAQWIKQIAAGYGKKVGEISYIFCSDSKILAVNLEYLQHDYFTDIITFDYSENDTLSGDLFISLETVKSNAEKFGVDYEEELQRVIIHGILHLCGQNDKSPKERAIMTQKEDAALALLNEKEG